LLTVIILSHSQPITIANGEFHEIGLATAAREAEATARRQELTTTEEKYMRSLKEHFHIVEIPGIVELYHH
jgi:hypothetical protein